MHVGEITECRVVLFDFFKSKAGLKDLKKKQHQNSRKKHFE